MYFVSFKACHKRVKWTNEERRILWDAFGEVIRAKALPSRHQCEQVLMTYAATFHTSRRWETIKAWCSNEKTKVLQST